MALPSPVLGVACPLDFGLCQAHVKPGRWGSPQLRLAMLGFCRWVLGRLGVAPGAGACRRDHLCWAGFRGHRF